MSLLCPSSGFKGLRLGRSNLGERVRNPHKAPKTALWPIIMLGITLLATTTTESLKGGFNQ